MSEFLTCPKCGARSGDDWSQCKGSCPMFGSPHHDPNALGNMPYTRDELVAMLTHLDDETEWETVNAFWEVWSPRLNQRIRRLIATALAGMPNVKDLP
jgi:hypothetical protein